MPLQWNHVLDIDRWSIKAFLFALIAIQLIAFAPALNGSFTYDDDLFIASNPQVTEDWGLKSLWLEPGRNTEWVPITYTFFWTYYRNFKEGGWIYHLTNLAFHILNGVLFWIVLNKLNFRRARWAALIFAIHPFNADAVAWIFQLRTLLPVFFTLSSFLFFLNFLERKKNLQYFAAIILFLLALLSKVSTLFYPLLLSLYFWYDTKKLLTKKQIYTSPFYVLSLIFGLFTKFLLDKSYTPDFAPIETWLQKLLIVGKNFWFYIQKFILPIDLRFFYPPWNYKNFVWLDFLPLFLLGSIAAIFSLLFFKTSKRLPLLLLGAYILLLFPTLGFIDNTLFETTLTMNHWHYAASLLPAGILCHFIFKLRSIFPSTLPHILMIVFCSAWVFQTRSHVNRYVNMETLMIEIIDGHPNAYNAHFNLGVIKHRRKELQIAKDHYLETIKIKPNHDKASFYLALLYETTGEKDQAHTYYNKALKITPHNPKLLEVYAANRISEKDYRTALQLLETLKIIQGENSHIHFSLGVAHTKLGNIEDAITSFEETLKLSPNHPKRNLILKQIDQFKKQRGDLHDKQF